MERTNSAEQPSHGRVVLVDNDLVLAKHTGAYTLDNTNLSGLLVLKLSQAEGEGAELLDNLGKQASRSRALELVGGGRTSVECGPVAVVLDLAGSQTDAHLNTPDLADLRQTIAPDALTRRKDDLLLGLDFVVLELPDGGALDKVAAVGLDNLLEHVGHLALCVGLLCGSLLLLLLVGVGDKTRWDHQPQQKLVGVVCSQNQICLASSNLLCGTDNNIVADDGAEAIDLSTQLDLDNLSLLQLRLGFFGVGLEGGVGGDVGAR